MIGIIPSRFDATTIKTLGVHPDVRFTHEDLLNPAIDWTDGDVVFANSTCFSNELMDGIASRAQAMADGALLITFSTAINSLWFKVVYKKRYTMSWGPATVFIHVKLE